MPHQGGEAVRVRDLERPLARRSARLSAVSGSPQHAARVGDPVAHSHALAGFLAGALVGIVAAGEAVAVVGAVVGAAALEVGTAGLATPLVVGVAATALEFGVGAYVGSKLMGAAEDVGEELGSQSLGPTSGAISKGSPNVRVNGRPAARATDAETCHDGVVAQGSLKVHVNGQPATRVGDKTSCGGVITAGSPNVVFEGPPDTRASIQSEVPEWVRWAAIVVSILPAVGQAARALGPALAEVEATGLGRAMQTGVKALGRAMEEKGGGARAPTVPAAPATPAPDPAPADPVAKPFSPEVTADAQRLGIPPAKVQEVLDTPKADRPPPESYVSPDRMAEHAKAFENGGSRLTLQDSVDKYGLGQRDGTTFISTSADTDRMLADAGGDPRKLEQSLGLPAGQLDNSQLVRVDFTAQAMKDLNMRMPSGTEAGANDQWLPGGYLPSGQNEAVIDGAKALPSHFNITPVGP